MSRRKSPTKKQEGVLLSYFGDTCVVSGDTGEHWHHLDDRSQNGATGNFIRISSRVNTALRDARNAAKAGPILATALKDGIGPEILLNTAADWAYKRWDFAKAYACARLAAHVLARYLAAPIDARLRALGRAVHFLRHRPQYELLDDLLRSDLLPQLRASKERLENSVLLPLIGDCTSFLMDSCLAFPQLEFLETDANTAVGLKSAMPAEMQAGAVRRYAYAGIMEGVKPRVFLDRLSRAQDLAPTNGQAVAAYQEGRNWHAFLTRTFDSVRDSADESASSLCRALLRDIPIKYFDSKQAAIANMTPTNATPLATAENLFHAALIRQSTESNADGCALQLFQTAVAVFDAFSCAPAIRSSRVWREAPLARALNLLDPNDDLSRLWWRRELPMSTRRLLRRAIRRLRDNARR